MTVLSAQSIQGRCLGKTPIRGDFQVYEPWERLIIGPFHATKQIAHGMSYGLTAAGYDIRLGRPDDLEEGSEFIFGPSGFRIAHSLEYLQIPEDVQAIVHDKSSWARRGLSLFNTVLEPGWCGWITLELANHSCDLIRIPWGAPIAQVVFHQLDQRTDRPYEGKYQNQPNRPVPTIREGEPSDSSS